MADMQAMKLTQKTTAQVLQKTDAQARDLQAIMEEDSLWGGTYIILNFRDGDVESSWIHVSGDYFRRNFRFISDESPTRFKTIERF